MGLYMIPAWSIIAITDRYGDDLGMFTKKWDEDLDKYDDTWDTSRLVIVLYGPAVIGLSSVNLR